MTYQQCSPGASQVLQEGTIKAFLDPDIKCIKNAPTLRCEFVRIADCIKQPEHICASFMANATRWSKAKGRTRSKSVEDPCMGQPFFPRAFNDQGRADVAIFAREEP